MGPELIPMIEAAAPALGLMAGGTALNMFGQQRAADQRRDILNQQLARTAATQDHAAQQVLDEGQKYTPQTRMAQLMADQQAIGNQSQQDLGAGMPVPSAAGGGAVSGDYKTSKAVSDAMEGQRMNKITEQLAAQRAPGLMGIQEAQSRANLTGDIGHQWAVDRNLGNAAQLDVQNVQEPWWGQLGGIASQLGMLYGLNTTKKAPGSAPQPPPPVTGDSRREAGIMWG